MILAVTKLKFTTCTAAYKVLAGPLIGKKTESPEKILQSTYLCEDNRLIIASRLFGSY